MFDSHGRFIWYELVTTDVKAAKAFYTKVVGWGMQEVAMPGISYTLFTAGGTSVSGLMDLPEEARKSGFRPSWLGYVGVDDVDAAADRISRLGGAVHVPPKEIPNISRFSVAVDPQMATIALCKWLEGGGQHQTPELDKPGHVGWHELFAADWEKAFPFYADLFGWQKANTDTGATDSYQLFSSGGVTIGGMLNKPPMAPIPFWLYYFNVDDIDAAAKRVRVGRGKILNGPIELPGDAWILQCTDPQGAIFALLGKRNKDAVEQSRTSEVDWSAEWNGLSSTGRLVFTKVGRRP